MGGDSCDETGIKGGLAALTEKLFNAFRYTWISAWITERIWSLEKNICPF